MSKLIKLETEAQYHLLNVQVNSFTKDQLIDMIYDLRYAIISNSQAYYKLQAKFEAMKAELAKKEKKLEEYRTQYLKGQNAIEF